MSEQLIIFILAAFIGYFVVRGVTPALYSPLMSVSNAISGIVVLGAIGMTGFAENIFVLFFGLIAVFLASVNMFGGFAVSVRMLEMFKSKRKKQ